MREEGPVARLQLIAAPGIRTGLRVFLLLIFPMVLFSVGAVSSSAKGPDSPRAKSSQAAHGPEEFVGQDTCVACHEEIAKGFASNPHTRIAEMHGKSGVTCEGCHGPGKAHVDGGGDATKIFNPAKAPAKEVDAKCLTCHQGQHANF